MVNQILINYITEGKSKGYSIEDLKKNLIVEGWSIEEVEAASNVNFEEKRVSQNQVPSKSKNNRPVGVMIVAILHWIIAGSMVIGGIVQLISQNKLISGFFPNMVSGVLSGLLMVFVLVIALFPFFAGLGIWKGKNGWRIVAIVIGIIVTIAGIFSLLQPSFLGIVNLLIAGYIVGYLLFSKKGKEYFKK